MPKKPAQLKKPKAKPEVLEPLAGTFEQAIDKAREETGAGLAEVGGA